jgi:hypothetical protein
MVFLHGNVDHARPGSRPARAGLVRQVISKDRAVLDYGAYVPAEMRGHRRHGRDDGLGSWLVHQAGWCGASSFLSSAAWRA